MRSATEARHSNPPCIVLGLETQIGLGVVRELGRAGVRVIGIAQEPQAIGLASRYLWRRVTGIEPRSAALLQRLRELGEEHGPCSLIAVSEVNLAWLSSHRGGLGQVVPVLPPADALAIALDKQRTLALAHEVGIAVPRSEQPQSQADIERLAESFPFPAVLKWSDPGAVLPALEAHGLELVKAEYVYSGDEFRRAAARYEALGAWPLVQQYCAGQGLGQFFFMHRGQAVRRFQHLRIAEWPPEGGYSSVCESLPLEAHADLQQRSIALLQAMGWDGVAMVEYRYDPATRHAVLMEVNGRFWGSFPLAVAAGAGFALLSHALQGAGVELPLPPLKAGRRCRMMSTELKRLVRLLLQPGRIADRSFRVRRGAELWRFVADFFRPGVSYYVWAWDDPRPFLADVCNLFRRG
jgi:predicted ATP-grasp superfamily ATP-dependent carboligase